MGRTFLHNYSGDLLVTSFVNSVGPLQSLLKDYLHYNRSETSSFSNPPSNIERLSTMICFPFMVLRSSFPIKHLGCSPLSLPNPLCSDLSLPPGLVLPKPIWKGVIGYPSALKILSWLLLSWRKFFEVGVSFTGLSPPSVSVLLVNPSTMFVFYFPSP